MKEPDKVPAPPPDRFQIRAKELLLTVAMGHASRIQVDGNDVPSYYHGLLKESDRAAGILAFAFLESQITALFAQQLDSKMPGGIAAILGPSGILDTVSARLKMLRALHWLRQDTYSDLRLLANIRNRFAHSHAVLTFDDGKIRGYLSTIRKHEEKFADECDLKRLTIKQVFLVRSVMTLFDLYGDIALMPASLRSGMGPGGAFAAGYDRFPEQLQNALKACLIARELICEQQAEAP